KQVIRKLDVRLINFINEQNWALICSKGLPQFTRLNVVGNVVYFVATKLAVTQARHGVILVQALLGFGGGLNLPADQRYAQTGGEFVRQSGFTSTGLTL